MSYKSTQQNLVGKFKVKSHAVDRFIERYGNEYIGNQKIKNMGENKLKRKIVKSLRERREYINEQDDGSLFVKTKDFKAIVMPYFKNTVITII